MCATPICPEGSSWINGQCVPYRCSDNSPCPPVPVPYTPCNKTAYENAREQLSTLEQKFADLKTKYYTLWQTLHQSGQYNGTWEQYAQENFWNSTEITDLTQIRDTFQQSFKYCMIYPSPVPPVIFPKTICSPDDYQNAKNQSTILQQRYGDLKMKFYTEWQGLNQSGQYNGTWDQFKQEKFLNSPELANLNQDWEKYNQYLGHCIQVIPYHKPTPVLNPSCNQTGYEQAQKELATIGQQWADLRAKYFAEWQGLNQSGQYNGTWEQYAKENLYNSSQLAQLNQDREKWNAIITNCVHYTKPLPPQYMPPSETVPSDNTYNDILSGDLSSTDNLANELAPDNSLINDIPAEAGSQSPVPSWVKNNAGWWANGQIGNSDFTSGIQYLAEQKIIKVSGAQQVNATSQAIPAWVKGIAGWWAEGKISDNDFVSAIQFLVNQGIIKT